MASSAACGDPNRLPDAIFENTVDTVTVFAVAGTAVHLPSGYAMTERRPVRLDQSTNADFAYDRTPEGDHVFLPGFLVGQGGSGGIDPGLQPTTTPFDEIERAILNGYIARDPVPLAAGDVFYLRSRIPGSCFLGVPAYGKLEVLEFDEIERSVTFQILVNLNCGYRDLVEGLPER